MVVGGRRKSVAFFIALGVGLISVQPRVHGAVALEHLDLYASFPKSLSQAQATNPATHNDHLEHLLWHHCSNRNAA
jgi:hypothetical protein